MADAAGAKPAGGATTNAGIAATREAVRSFLKNMGLKGSEEEVTKYMCLTIAASKDPDKEVKEAAEDFLAAIADEANLIHDFGFWKAAVPFWAGASLLGKQRTAWTGIALVTKDLVLVGLAAFTIITQLAGGPGAVAGPIDAEFEVESQGMEVLD